MKKYICSSGSAVDTYKNVTIYDDGVFYIYTKPHGGGRIDFSNMKDVRDYIDAIPAEVKPKVKKKYRVDYYNSVRSYESVYVDAYDEAEAKRLAQKMMGNEIWRIDDVIELDDGRW